MNNSNQRTSTFRLRVGVAILSVLSLTACGSDPLKDWSNSKLHSQAAKCANTEKHTPRSGIICNQVKDSCSFRGISCK